LAKLYHDFPAILLLDEPESDLDLFHVHQLIKYCKYMAAQNVCVVVATHDMGFARAIATHVCGIEKGQIVWNSKAEDFWDSYAFYKLFGLNKI
jgi:ABC-type polar amino acid transport system ATPase subunit